MAAVLSASPHICMAISGEDGGNHSKDPRFSGWWPTAGNYPATVYTCVHVFFSASLETHWQALSVLLRKQIWNFLPATPGHYTSPVTNAPHCISSPAFCLFPYAAVQTTFRVLLQLGPLSGVLSNALFPPNSFCVCF